MELLEFLGTLEDDDTRWMVPCKETRHLKQDDERDDAYDRIGETGYDASE